MIIDFKFQMQSKAKTIFDSCSINKKRFIIPPSKNAKRTGKDFPVRFFIGENFMRYETEDEILKIVESFENGTISKKDWRHADHLLVANHYLSTNDFDTAYRKMRDGIFNLLRAFKIDLTKEMPYHETLTVFWLKTIEEFRKTKNGCPVVGICNAMTEKFDSDYPLRFYSRELLFSEKARAEFVEPDISSDKISAK